MASPDHGYAYAKVPTAVKVESMTTEIDISNSIDISELDDNVVVRCGSCGLTGSYADVLVHAETCDGTVPNTNDETREKQQLNNDETYYWPRKAILALISLYEEHEDMFNSPRYTKKAVWKTIGDIMQERGYRVSPLQIENKWKHLNKRYKRIKCSSNPAIASRITTWPYFQAMDAILGKKRDVDSDTEVFGAKSSIEPCWVRTLRNDMARREKQAQKRHEEFIRVQRDNQLLFRELMLKFIDVVKK